MQQIFRFIEKYRYFLLFLLLEFIAIFLTIQNHSYHKSKFINSANNVTGGIYKRANNINEFFSLKKENQRLSEENARLKNLIALEFRSSDSTNSLQRYSYTNAKIYNNSYSRQNNYITINKGEKDGVSSEMAVVNSNGIVGITKSVSNNYATVMSVLNEHSLINAKTKNQDHFGTLSWNGKDYRTIQLIDLPREAIVKVGDTVITGGKSTIFPEGIFIGSVKDIHKNNGIIQSINITLFNNMSSLSHVHVITNLHKEEILELESNNNE